MNFLQRFLKGKTLSTAPANSKEYFDATSYAINTANTANERADEIEDNLELIGDDIDEVKDDIRDLSIDWVISIKLGNQDGGHIYFVMPKQGEKTDDAMTRVLNYIKSFNAIDDLVLPCTGWIGDSHSVPIPVYGVAYYEDDGYYVYYPGGREIITEEFFNDEMSITACGVSGVIDDD